MKEVVAATADSGVSPDRAHTSEDCKTHVQEEMMPYRNAYLFFNYEKGIGNGWTPSSYLLASLPPDKLETTVDGKTVAPDRYVKALTDLCVEVGGLLFLSADDGEAYYPPDAPTKCSFYRFLNFCSKGILEREILNKVGHRPKQISVYLPSHMIRFSMRDRTP
jgi:hypothetical protein